MFDILVAYFLLQDKSFFSLSCNFLSLWHFADQQVINDMLPKLSKKLMDALIAESQDAQYKLELVPTTTLEFVESLTFLDEIQIRVSNMSNERKS